MKEKELFSNRQLKDMIIPLFLEQLLVMCVGIADTLVISYAGEAAASGVSLVNQFNTIFIYLFTALFISYAWNLLIFALTPAFLRFYSLSAETKQLVIWLVLIHNVFNAVAFPFSGALSNGLRAAGDVKFTMYVSVISTIAMRLFLSYLLGIVLQMGVIGIALAMVLDWILRAVLFIWREKTGKWKMFRVISA